MRSNAACVAHQIPEAGNKKTPWIAEFDWDGLISGTQLVHEVNEGLDVFFPFFGNEPRIGHRLKEWGDGPIDGTNFPQYSRSVGMGFAGRKIIFTSRFEGFEIEIVKMLV